MHMASDRVTDFERDGTKMMQIGEYLYSFGGWTPGQSYSDVYRSSGDLSEWEKLADAPWFGRHVFGIGEINDKFFVYGGDIYSYPVLDCWSTLDGENWTEETSHIPFAWRMQFGSAWDSSAIYIIGGQKNYSIPIDITTPTDILRSTNGSDWERVGDGIPYFARVLSGAVVFYNGRLWVISGGVFGALVGSREVYSSIDSGATWTRENDVPFSGRYYHDCIVWDNKLWVVGGYNTSGNLKDIWYMDDQGNWNEFIPPQGYIGRHATGVAVYNDKLVIACGNMHNDCWIIEK